MQRGYPGVYGQPVRPQIEASVVAGSDVWVDVQALDRFGVAQIPTSVTWQVDDLSSRLNMVQATTFTPVSSAFEIHVPAASNVIQNPTRASIIAQMMIAATLPDGSVIKVPRCWEVVAINTPSGAGF